jgi:hypothetical protein
MGQVRPKPEPGEGKGTPAWTTHRVFGLRLDSDYPFASRLAKGSGTPHLTFSCVDQPPLDLDREQIEPSYASPPRTGEGEGNTLLYRLGACDILRFSGVADFFLWSDRIDCHILDPAYGFLVELRLLGPVLAYWLERQGIITLHTSAVQVKHRAVGFLSSNEGGKTALAAAIMQAGHALLTDDILAVAGRGDTYAGRPSYPQMRMWPDEVAHFLGRRDDLEVVHPRYSKVRVPVGADGFGVYARSPVPLASIYLPKRRLPGAVDRAIEITQVSRRDAVIELVRHSVVSHMVEAVGWQPRRLDFVAGMVARVPLRRLVYPSGFEHLPRVRDAILEDMAKLL